MKKKQEYTSLRVTREFRDEIRPLKISPKESFEKMFRRRFRL